MANILSKLPSKHERILHAAYEDLIVFGKLFLAGDFNKSKTPLFHYEIAEELLSPSNKPCAIIIARGHAKTTLIKAKILHDFCFAKKAKEWGLNDKDRHFFFGWCSSNQKKSINNVRYIKLHLEFNDKINFYFGKGQLGNMRGDVWNQEDIVTAYGDRLLSSSNLTSMRGDTMATIHAGALRYSSVFVDDAENEDNTRTLGARDKIVDNIMNGILPAIEKNEPGCRLFFIATPVHWDSFAQNILDKWNLVQAAGESAEDVFSWKVITYGVSQPHLPGGVLWHSWLPREKLDEIKQTYADSPRGVDGYYQEYELEVQSEENALWGRKHLKYWKGYYTRRDGRNCLFLDNNFVPINTFIGCDPATDIDTKNSDYSVIMVIGVDSNNNVYVLEYLRARSIPTLALRDNTGEIIGKKGVVDWIIELYQKYNCTSGTVEDVAMNRSIFQSLNAELHRLNYPSISIIPEKPGGKEKINRIYSGLNGRFSNGQIYVQENQHELINEIVKFGPKMAHDDTIESLYYACRYAYPVSNLTKVWDQIETYTKKIRRAKSWIVN